MRVFFDSLQSKEIAIFMERYPLSEDIAAHNHDFIEMAYVLEGTVQHSSNGKTCTAHAGDYFILDVDTPHIYHTAGKGSQVINCIFLPAFIDSSLHVYRDFNSIVKHYLVHFDERFNFRPYSGTVFHDPDRIICERLFKIEQEYHERGPGYLQMIRSYLIELIICTLRQLPVESAERDVDIQFVKEMVRKHSSEKLCLSELARQLNITVPALSQKFTRVVGMGYKEYLQNYRIGEACRLLANSNEKVADIATMVGYQDLKFFHLIFHRVIGLSPSDYRREQRKSQKSNSGAEGRKEKA